jgi:hypothetical protein
MKLFNLISVKYDQFINTVHAHLAKVLGEYNVPYTISSIFGQLINVLGSAVQNMFSYIEDAIMEQSKNTATRKNSIYGLAQLSGYNPSLGTASTATVRISYKPNNEETANILIPNKTKLRCSYNGMTYNIIFPQEAIVLDVSRDNTYKYLNIVEGKFESQTFQPAGGALYTIPVKFKGDCDIDYLEVIVNGEKWDREACLYDMSPDGKQYFARTSIKDGIDIVFGNSQFGRQIKDGDLVEVNYLIHNGEYGNIPVSDEVTFEFIDTLKDTSGIEISANNIVNIDLETEDNVSSGTFSEAASKVKEMIGYNSRSLVLADPKNYKLFLSRFSFVGYNRTWTEEGSLVINSLITRNNVLDKGRDYFTLQESDFMLSKEQKNSIKTAIGRSGQQLAGAIYNIFDPELVKYAMFMYVKLKETTYDTEYITNSIKDLVGNFFHDIHNDIFIPKSDIIQLIKNNIPEIDGIDIYILCEQNEKALKSRHYTEKTYRYNPSRGTYDISKREVYLYDGENPNLGLDEHGNIFLDNADQIPVLMGGWSYQDDDDPSVLVSITDPLSIIYTY